MRVSRDHLHLLILSLLALLTMANDGTVVSLGVSGGGNFDETITISAVVQATAKVNNSNIYFEIRDPNGTVVATNSASPPSMEAGATFSYSWSSNNSGYPSMGNYTVTLCWSTGNAQNCDVSNVTTGFYSVPTLGVPLSIVAVLLLGVWFWHVKGKLAGQKAVSA